MTDGSRPRAIAYLLIALVGALLFGIGLASGVWFYLIHVHNWPELPLMTPGIAVRNVLLFTAFALHHSVMARSAVKRWLMTVAPPCLERSIYVWVASLLFISMCIAWQPTRDVVWVLRGIPEWIATALQVAGLVITAFGARVLDIWDLAGVRQVLAAIRPARDPGRARVPAKESEPLDTITARGPYGFVRHPIYFGWLLLVWPTPLMTSGRLLFAAISTLYLVVAIPLEERSLLRHFGRQYREYQGQVRFRLIPGVW